MWVVELIVVGKGCQVAPRQGVLDSSCYWTAQPRQEPCWTREAANLGLHGAGGEEVDKEAFFTALGMPGEGALGEAPDGSFLDDVDDPNGGLDPP